MEACGACGGDLPPLRSRGRPRKWCSESCRLWALRNPGQTRVVALKCERCGVDIRPPKRSWCSKRCHDIARGMVLPEPRAPRVCGEPGCGKKHRSRGLCQTHYSRKYRPNGWRAIPKDPDRERARQRAKTHLRRARMRHSDVTLDYERRLREKAKRCPLCMVRMVGEPYLPTSKELDHIVPLGVGGTHTVGNVRIICRACNFARPKDGSDYAGPVTLFALEVA